MYEDPRQAMVNLFEIEDKLRAMKEAGEVVDPYVEVVEVLRGQLGSALQRVGVNVDVLDGAKNMLALMHQVIGKVSGVTDTSKFEDIRMA